MKVKIRAIIFMWAILFSLPAFSQLNANFSITDLSGLPIVGGCSPQIIRCNDLSIGNPTSWSWSIQPGNITSTLQNPVFGLVNQGPYTITLTITAGGVSRIFSQNFTVYPNPVVDFSADFTQGCTGFTSCFSDLSNGQGFPIVNWQWDFGDGTVVQGDSAPCHIFNNPSNPNNRCFNITLIATNSQGCSANRVKNNFICLTPRPTVNFFANNRTLCNQPFIVAFFDSSVSVNGLTYFWEFGDNNTSTLRNPTHTYLNAGCYNVRLTVTDTVCNESVTIIKNNYICAGSVRANFSVISDTVCAGVAAQFVDSSSGNITAWLWNFGVAGATSSQQLPTYTYANAGTYNVSLRVTSNLTCVDDTIVNAAITVLPQPTGNITANSTSSCRAPFTVNFNSNALNAIDYLWNFGDQDTLRGVANPSHTYQNPGTYTVSVVLFGANGCNRTVTQNNFIRVDPTIVNFAADSLFGCAPLNLCFRDSSVSIDPIISWAWNFGDPNSGINNSSNLVNPCHLFQNTGSYNVQLTINTQTGCTATITKNITSGNKPNIGFTASDLSPCVNVPVLFTNTSTGVPTPNTFLWNAIGAGTSTSPSPSFIWEEPGLYVVIFTAGNNGCNADTTVTITVLDPLAEFDFTANCNVFGRVTFNNTSVNATSYLWEFGDGATSTSANPIHTYSSGGIYSVTLTATSSVTGCSTEFTEDITISNTQSNFSALVTSGCAPLAVTFNNTATGSGLRYFWNFGVLGILTDTSSSPNPTYSYTTSGAFTVSLTVTDVNGCANTFSRPNYIRVSDVTPNFQAIVPYGCLPEIGIPQPIIQFQDLSTASVGSTISNWNWDFGNGTQAFSLPGSPPPSPVTRAYALPQLYNVSLTVTTNLGCQRTLTRNQYIDINQPIANLSTDFNLYCPNQDIEFNNLSTGESLTYQWSFNDPSVPGGGTSTAVLPTYAYADTGYYDIRLIATDIYGCRDTVEKNDLFFVGTPELDFFTLDTFRNCPPFVVTFTNLTTYDTLDINRIEWDFGDGSGAVNVQNPSKIYTRAGFFTVTVLVSFENGCQDSLTINNYINIGGAVGDLTLSEDTICKGDCILLDANSISATNRFWLFGDGIFEPGEDTISHCFLQPNLYPNQPCVVLTDNQSPPCSYTLCTNDTLIVDSVRAFFVTNLNDSVCQNAPIQFIDSSAAFILDSIVRWDWDFGDAGVSTLQNPIYTYTTPGTKTVTLTAYNAAGCINTYSRQIYVIDKGRADFAISDSLGCDSLFTTFTDISVPGDFPILSWDWDFGNTLVNNDTSNLQGPHNYSYNLLGTYNVRLIINDEYCADTVVKPVFVYPVPNGIADPDTVQICFNDSIRLNGDPQYAAWDWTPGIYLNDSTVAQPWAYGVDTTTYVLITTDFTTCQSFDTVTVIVLPLPPLSLNPYPEKNICLGDTLPLIANGSLLYEWMPNVEINNNTIPNPVVYPTLSRYYKVTTTDIFGCKSSDSVRVVINKFNTIFEGERSCLGNPADFVSISGATDRSIEQWLWDFGVLNSNTDIDSGRVVNYTYPDSGIYNVQLVVVDSIGCTDTLIKQVKVDFPPDAFAETDTIICFGESVQLFSGGGIDSVYWTPITYIDNRITYNPFVSPRENTIYTVHVTNGICPFDTAQVNIKVQPLPFVKSIENKLINKGVTIELNTVAPIYDSLYWFTLDTSITCTDCLSPVAQPLTSTFYVVNVIDELGCLNLDTVFITVNEFCNEDVVFVPTAFTPNGDGSNDLLYARMFGAKELIFFRIFDRWGGLLFETKNSNIGWDGTNRDGEKLITGVYVYAIEALCYDGDRLIKKGNVTLLK